MVGLANSTCGCIMKEHLGGVLKRKLRQHINLLNKVPTDKVNRGETFHNLCSHVQAAL